MEQWTVPEAVAKRALASGPECRHWMENISGLISKLEDEWHIRVCKPFPGGTDAFVAPAVRRDGTECVIRLDMPDDSALEDMRKASAAFILAEEHGYARLLREDETHLDDFSVTAAGIGSALIRAAEEYAGQIGSRAVLLHVEKANTSAMRFYERYGYSVFRDDGNRFLLKKDIS